MKEKNEKFKRTLPVPLMEWEKVEFGKKLADLRLNQEETTVRKAAASEQFKNELVAIDLGVKNTAQIIRQGFENRPVECLWVFEYAGGFKNLTRLDTLEIIETLGLTQEERQRELDLSK